MVEDEVLLQLTLTLMLEKMGFSHITKVPSGTEAVELALEESFDLILMDIMLKDHVDGIEAYRRIKRQCGEVPIIYITSNTDSISRKKRAAQLGYHAYINKPASFKQLKQSIDELFQEVDECRN